MSTQTPTPAEQTPTSPEFCLCGCSEKVGKKSFFRPGHDARHVSNLLAVAISDNLTWAGAVEQILPALPSEALKYKFTAAWNRYQDRLAKKAEPRAKVQRVPVGGHVAKVGRWTYPVQAVQTVKGGKTIKETFERNTARDGSGEWVAVDESALIDA